MDAQIQRQKTRITVDIPVMVTTVVDSLEATIADLNPHGALLTGCVLDVGTRFQIEYMGQTVYAQCRWAEIDRMGISFSFTLNDGPLYDRLMYARAESAPHAFLSGESMTISPIHARSTVRGFGRARVTGGFGRRTA